MAKILLFDHVKAATNFDKAVCSKVIVPNLVAPPDVVVFLIAKMPRLSLNYNTLMYTSSQIFNKKGSRISATPARVL
jgi:hypothetical protein